MIVKIKVKILPELEKSFSKFLSVFRLCSTGEKTSTPSIFKIFSLNHYNYQFATRPLYVDAREGVLILFENQSRKTTKKSDFI